MKVKVKTECAIVYNDKIVFFAEQYNSLCQIQIDSGKLEWLGSIQNEKKMDRLYGYAHKLGKRIVLMPFHGINIAIYDVEKNSIDIVQLPSEFEKYENKTASSVVYENNIYFTASFINRIYCLNVEKNVVECICDYSECLDDNLWFDNSDDNFRRDAIIVNSNMITPFCNRNALLIFNLITKEVDVKYLGDEDNGYSGICFKDECLICSPRKEGMRLLKCNFEKNIIQYGEKTNKVYTGIVNFGDEYRLLDGAKYEFWVSLDNDGSLYYDNEIEKLCLYQNNECKSYELIVDIPSEIVKNKFCGEIQKEKKDFCDLQMFIECITQV